MTPDTVIVDLDGTLSNCSARQHLVMGKKRDYAAFHARLHEDPVHEWCASLLFALREAPGRMRVVLLSARPQEYERATKAWLATYAPWYDELVLLRAGPDSAPADALKREWVRSYGATRILLALDDDPRNAAMFKEEGVACLLAPGWVTLPKEGA